MEVGVSQAGALSSVMPLSPPGPEERDVEDFNFFKLSSCVQKVGGGKKLIDYSTCVCFDESAVHWNRIQIQDL